MRNRIVVVSLLSIFLMAASSPVFLDSNTRIDQRQKKPLPAILVNSPGNGSRLISPLELNLSLAPSPENLIQIELVGSDNRLIARLIEKIEPGEADRVDYRRWIEFDPIGDEEPARLLVIQRDKKNRKTSVASVDVILTNDGNLAITPNTFPYDHFVVDSTELTTKNQVKILIISGKIKTFNDNPVVLDLVMEGGAVLGTRLLQVAPPAEGKDYTEFKTDIPFSAPGSVDKALLTIWQYSKSRITSIMGLSTWEMDITIKK